MQYRSWQCAALRGEPLRQAQPSAPGCCRPRVVHAAGWSSDQAPAASSQNW